MFSWMTKQTQHIKPPTHKGELQQRNYLGKVSRKATGSLKQFYSRETSREISDASPIYKHMSGPHKGLLPHQWNVVVKRI